ncbi:MAG: RNA methyltransferase, partial [Planctomycetes bacterium]|nr:RNA methyltransferase [Planctomycetota bacterium]
HLLLEGAHLLEEALEAGAELRWVLHDQRPPPELLRRAAAAGAEVLACEPGLLDELADLDSPRGLLALARRPSATAAEVLSRGGLVLVSAGVQEPGNVGALVRVAAGLGASGFVALKGSASPWSPRALRGASGTTFRLPVAERVEAAELLAAVAAAGVELWGAEASGAAVAGLAPAGPVALLLGEEGRGLPAELITACSRLVAIPLARGVESLNVATAAAVLAWELGGRGKGG